MSPLSFSHTARMRSAPRPVSYMRQNFLTRGDDLCLCREIGCLHVLTQIGDR